MEFYLELFNQFLQEKLCLQHKGCLLLYVRKTILKTDVLPRGKDSPADCPNKVENRSRLGNGFVLRRLQYLKKLARKAVLSITKDRSCLSKTLGELATFETSGVEFGQSPTMKCNQIEMSKEVVGHYQKTLVIGSIIRLLENGLSPYCCRSIRTTAADYK